jgi:hypothetical protein
VTRLVYAAWIETLVPTGNQAYGACSVITARMVAVFPELRRARGHYLCPFWGPREHWWCVTADGGIVDPTAHQFPSARKYPGSADGKYEEFVDGSPEPIGKCMECGAYCWAGRSPSSSACSPECARALEAEYGCPFGDREI